MVVVMQERASDEQVQSVIAKLTEMGFDVHRSTGALRTVLGAVGGIAPVRHGAARGARRRAGSASDHRAVQAREPHASSRRTRVITIGDVRIGGDEVIVMAGPCSAESEEQVEAAPPRSSAPAPRSCAAARSSRAARPTASRGSARKGCGCCAPRPTATTCKLISEVMDISQLELIERYAAHPPGRRAQHAELHAAARARPLAHAGHAQARHLGDDRGVAALGGVHPRRAAT